MYIFTRHVLKTENSRYTVKYILNYSEFKGLLKNMHGVLLIKYNQSLNSPCDRVKF